MYVHAVFKLIPTDNKEAKDALNHFAQTAKLIRRDSHFDNSIAHNIELMLQDTSGFIRRYGGYKCPPGEVRINRTCIALAAPSLVGKTNLHFSSNQSGQCFSCYLIRIQNRIFTTILLPSPAVW